jgi:hypothetical protein
MLLLACGEPERPDVGRYVEAARLAGTDPVAAAAACEGVGGVAQSECSAWAAAAVARTDAAAAHEICAGIGDEVWRDECGFLVAEETVRAVGAEAAARGCAQAGRFSDNCLMHVWKGHARALVAEKGFATASGEFGAALGWADGVIQKDEALENRFWDLFFDAAMGTAGESVAPLDTAFCATLDADLAERCRRGVPASLQRALNRADRKPSHAPGALDVVALCGAEAATLPLPSRIEAATGVRYVSSPELDAVASRFVDRRCAAAPPGVRP